VNIADREAYIGKLEEFSTKPKLIHNTSGVKKMIELMRTLHEEVKAFRSGKLIARKPYPTEMQAASTLEELAESRDLYDEIDEAGQPYATKDLSENVKTIARYIRQCTGVLSEMDIPEPPGRDAANLALFFVESQGPEKNVFCWAESLVEVARQHSSSDVVRITLVRRNEDHV